jgi:hypothetical protein
MAGEAKVARIVCGGCPCCGECCCPPRKHHCDAMDRKVALREAAVSDDTQ